LRIGCKKFADFSLFPSKKANFTRHSLFSGECEKKFAVRRRICYNKNNYRLFCSFGEKEAGKDREFALNRIADAKRIVVKVGTSTLAHPTGKLNFRRMEEICRVLADLKNGGREVVLVTSGAIGVGCGKLALERRPEDTPSKQAAAAVGQCELMYLYDKFFSEYGCCVGQILLTRDVVEISDRKLHVVNTLHRLLEMGAVPIVNENDSVSVEEIEFGDNDTLSAIVATLCNADALVILSDIDGLFDRDPHKFPEAKLIPQVSELTDEILQSAGGVGSKLGTGGMVTKLHAAEIALQKGIPMALINGNDPHKLYHLFDGEPVGTLFAR